MKNVRRGIFIVYDDLENPTGVNKKILNQIAAFREKGVDMLSYKMKIKEVFGYKLLYRLPFTNLSPEWEVQEEILGCDFIYLRRPLFMNIYFLRFMRIIKKKRPEMKILMEIPTYPYDKEITKNIRNWPIYIKDVFARKKIKKYIDAIPLLTDEENVFGIKTIKIKNGYNFNNSRARIYDINKCSIDIAIIAQFDVWHGYDRLIEGLHQYYLNKGNREIVLHFVGDGPELPMYKNMASAYNLENHIKFYGMRDKDFLTKIYDICDIGASSFGLFKKDLDFSCDLKSREYLSVGLPIICGSKMDIMEYPELKDFILEFPNDASFVSMEKVVEFYNSLYGNKDEEDVIKMIQNIRTIAVKNLNMEQAMKRVFQYIN